jgi:GTP cyclohydrolase I
MTTRGIHKTETSTVTTRMIGAFKEPDVKKEFLKLISSDIS